MDTSLSKTLVNFS